MKKIFIFPYNSLILYDLVQRAGHHPLAVMQELRRRTEAQLVSSPPYNITSNDLRAGLEHCSVDVPSGVRGRLAFLAPLVEAADAAIFTTDPEYSFGSSGCARANEFVWHLVLRRGIPTLTVKYPRNHEEASKFVTRIASFLKEIEE